MTVAKRTVWMPNADECMLIETHVDREAEFSIHPSISDIRTVHGAAVDILSVYILSYE